MIRSSSAARKRRVPPRVVVHWLLLVGFADTCYDFLEACSFRHEFGHEFRDDHCDSDSSRPCGHSSDVASFRGAKGLRRDDTPGDSAPLRVSATLLRRATSADVSFLRLDNGARFDIHPEFSAPDFLAASETDTSDVFLAVVQQFLRAVFDWGDIQLAESPRSTALMVLPVAAISVVVAGVVFGAKAMAITAVVGGTAFCVGCVGGVVIIFGNRSFLGNFRFLIGGHGDAPSPRQFMWRHDSVIPRCGRRDADAPSGRIVLRSYSRGVGGQHCGRGSGEDEDDDNIEKNPDNNRDKKTCNLQVKFKKKQKNGADDALTEERVRSLPTERIMPSFLYSLPYPNGKRSVTRHHIPSGHVIPWYGAEEKPCRTCYEEGRSQEVYYARDSEYERSEGSDSEIWYAGMKGVNNELTAYARKRLRQGNLIF